MEKYFMERPNLENKPSVTAERRWKGTYPPMRTRRLKNFRRPYFTLVAMFFAVAGCAPFVDVLDVKSVPMDERAAASNVQIIPVGFANLGEAKFIGPVEATSCKHWITDPPSSKANATEQLKIKAIRMGANAIIDYSCDASGTGAYGTNCWNSVSCGGTAVQVRSN